MNFAASESADFFKELNAAFENARIIAVTGRMASGKNAVCQILSKKGAACVDADILVHLAIKNQNSKIIQTFEPFAKQKNLIIKNDDGSVNRRTLGELLFSDANLLKMQEDIVYPEVTALTKEFITENQKCGKLCVINATVLYKTPELLDLCDFIIFVDAPFFKRFLRARKRDGIKTLVLLKRFSAQKNLLMEYQKTGKKIFVLKNGGNLSDLQKKLN